MHCFMISLVSHSFKDTLWILKLSNDLFLIICRSVGSALIDILYKGGISRSFSNECSLQSGNSLLFTFRLCAIQPYHTLVILFHLAATFYFSLPPHLLFLHSLIIYLWFQALVDFLTYETKKVSANHKAWLYQKSVFWRSKRCYLTKPQNVPHCPHTHGCTYTPDHHATKLPPVTRV